MTRWLTLCLALVLALTLGGIGDVSATTKTEKMPAKSDAKAPAKADDKKMGDKAADKKKGPIDINTASAEELQTIAGIGDAYAKKIVENRPYKRKDEIVKKAGVPQATYDKVKDQIIAKQAKAEKKMDEKKADAKRDDKKK